MTSSNPFELLDSFPTPPPPRSSEKMTVKMSSPFHRLLSFFASRSAHPSTSIITFRDSLRGDLSLGLNFPIALFLAVTRHLVFGNAPGWRVDVPSVRTSRVLLGGPGRFTLDSERRYGLRELLGATSGAGVSVWLDAVGCWALVARRDGTILGREVEAYQKGEVMEEVVRRRRGRGDVLPFWRGGPI